MAGMNWTKPDVFMEMSFVVEPNKVICSSKGDLLWIDYLPSAILLLAGEGLFEAVGCEDGTVYIYSPAGRR